MRAKAALLVFLLLLGACRARKRHFPDLKGAPAAVERLVEIGDAHFADGMTHLERSDPSVNPDWWPDENNKALGFFKRAINEGYLPAQEAYGKDPPPPELLDRFRDAQMRAALCRKRAYSRR